MADPDDFAQRPLRIDEDTPGVPIEKMAGGKRRPLNVLPMQQQAGRMPPQATDVEQSVLGAMLIEREAIPKAIEILPADAFYEPRHQRIFEAVEALFERGNPVDLITLTEELKRRGDYDGIGGYYLTELTTRVASAANVEYHARIIAEKSLLRKLITTMTGVVGQAFDPTTDAFDLLDNAEREIFQISESQLRKGAVDMNSVVHATMQHLESIHGREGGITGVPSGFTALDAMTGGWQPSDMIIIAARPSMGKCLGKGTRVMMHDGTLKAVEDIRVGDLLMGDDSTPRRVLSLARGQEEMYWVRQTYGIDYRVNASHILSVKKSRRGGREPRGSVTDIEVRDYLDRSPKWRNDHKGYKVAVDFPERDLPLDPYFVGLWLGDGKSDSSRIYTQDEEVVGYLHELADARGEAVTVTDMDRCPGYTVTGGRGGAYRTHSVQAILREMGVLGDKHIPHEYLASSRRQRLALLAGLVDSDGHRNAGHGGTVEITQKDRRLAQQIKRLCDTLGYRTSIRAKTARSQTGFEGIVWRVRFNGDLADVPTRVARKTSSAWSDFRDWTVSGLTLEADGVDDYYGFEIDGNRRFLLEDGTVTHNTALSLAVTRNAALHPEKPAGVAYFSLEMSAQQLAQRLLTSEARVDAQRARTGRLHDDDWPKLARAAGRLSAANIFIDDTPGLGILELRAKCRRLKAEHGIGLVIVDYLQLMHGTTQSKGGNREQEIAQISRSLKGLAKELDVPVIALSQLSRAVETRGGDKRPQLSDLRESGSIEQDADVVMFIYRAERYGITVDENGNSTEGLGELLIGKQRNGPIGDVKVAFVNQYARFENLTSYVVGDSTGGYEDYPPSGSLPPAGGDGFTDSGPPPLPPPATDAPF
ncbi:MAG: replicative DNA helicase [Bacteroidota bacterium]